MRDNRFIHWSMRPLCLTKLRTEKQAEESVIPGKPHGMWFTVGNGEDSWRAWCEAEDFHPTHLVHATEVIFKPTARVLKISTPNGLVSFTERYGFVPPWMREPTAWSLFAHYGKGYSINWGKVAKRYDAVVIAPYLWECRLSDKTFWYYGWDCASGCVWNIKAIDRLKPIVSHYWKLPSTRRPLVKFKPRIVSCPNVPLISLPSKSATSG